MSILFQNKNNYVKHEGKSHPCPSLVHCITPSCSDELVSPPNLYPPWWKSSRNAPLVTTIWRRVVDLRDTDVRKGALWSYKAHPYLPLVILKIADFKKIFCITSVMPLPGGCTVRAPSPCAFVFAHPVLHYFQERIKGTEKASPIHTLFHR